MKRTAFAAAFALAAAAGLSAPAGAQPRLEQTGDGYSVVHGGDAGSGSAVGGREGRLVGGGEDAAVLYTGPDAAREGRSATLSGGGEDAVVSYAEPARAAAARRRG
jgi:hypothetical protein